MKINQQTIDDHLARIDSLLDQAGQRADFVDNTDERIRCLVEAIEKQTRIIGHLVEVIGQHDFKSEG